MTRRARSPRPLVAALALAGCQASNQPIGTGVGAVLGSVLGSRFGVGGGKVAMVALGTAAGAWIGREVGGAQDEQDRQRLADATRRTAASGEPVVWKNPDSGVSGSARVTATRTDERTVRMPALKGRVERLPPMDLIGETYRATGAGKVRGGPGTDYVVVDSLASGAVVTVAGRVQGAPWYLISRGGAAAGFVHEGLLRPEVGAEPSPAAVADAELEVRPVETRRTCRTIEQAVTLADGSTRNERVTACQTPDGWSIAS